MGAEFNKKLMLDNISFMLKELGMKIGELETDAGVSAGYISRTTKDGTGKPGIDFIIKVAEALNISVDTLLKVELSGLTPTERYLISFLEKLKSDTVEDKLDWEKHTADSLNRLGCDDDGNVYHPLFGLETFFEDGETEYPIEVTRVVFTSNSYGCQTYINDDCFSLKLKNRSVLYLMDISKSVHYVSDEDVFAREIWIYKPQVGAQYLCSNIDNSPLAAFVDDVFSVVKNFVKHPKIKKGLQDVLDAFMADDFSDDFDGDLPF